MEAKNTDGAVHPLEQLFDDYQYALNIDKGTPLHIKVQKVDKEADVRAAWLRLLEIIPANELDFVVFNQKLSNGEKVRNMAIKFDLLPEAYKISPKIRTASHELNIGNLAELPTEIRNLIFSLLTLSDVMTSSSVSKSWMSITAANFSSNDETNAKESSIGLADAISRARRRLINEKIWKHKDHYIYATDVEVTDGKGLLVCEEGYLQGIKLNNVPIICAWNGEMGMMAREMVRSKVVTKKEIAPLTKDIDSFLNEGTIDFLTLGDSLKPFCNFMANGGYRIRVQSNLFCWLIEYQSNEPINQVVGGSESDEENIYCTVPSDQLSAERIKFYEDKINQGQRLAVLTIKGKYDYFLLDGHHKIKAYYNLNKERKMIMISVEALDPIKLSRQDELAYIQHSVEGVEVFLRSEQAAEKRRLKRMNRK